MIPAADHQLLASQWFQRAKSERDAHHRFLQLSRDIQNHPTLYVLQEQLKVAAADEFRHIGLCTTQVQRFGGQNMGSYGGFQPFFPHHPLQEMVVLFCIMETINAALLVASKEHITDSVLRATCHEILKDEVQHARIGWAALSLSSAQEREAVWNELVPIFRCAGIDSVLQGSYFERHLPEWGVFGREARIRMLEQTMETVILPGFWSLGLSTAVTWPFMKESLGSLRAARKQEQT